MKLVFAIVYASTFVRCSVALPINETEPSWAPEPTGRGTLGILLPCLITLAFCVWTAIHLNVNPEPTKRRIFFFKLAWLLMGMFTPEIVLWCAINQFLEAREIREKVLYFRRERLGTPQPSYTGVWREQWAALKRRCAILKRPFRKNTSKDDQEKGPHLSDFSMGCAFFVVMGGYTIHPAPGIFNGIPVTLTPRGFILLYAQEMIKEEDLDPRLIADKTKADGLAKLIVCIQALWLVIQGIGRKANGLPLPLLELHTIMHVLCAVAMYWFWWDKPLDVRYPIILDLEQHVAEEIYSSYRVRDDGRSLPPQPRPGTPPNNGNSPPGDSVQGTEDTRQDALEGNTSRKSTTLDGAQAARTNANAATYSYRSHPTRLQNNRFRERFLREYFLQGLHDVHLWAVVLLSPIIILSQYVWWHQTFELWPSIGEDLTDLEVRLIKLARLRERGDVAQPFKQSPVMLGRPADRKLKPLCVRARMIQQTGLLRGYSKGHGLVSLEAFLVLACLSVLYGGAHAGAWNTHLPSTVERLLWRVSSVIAGTFVPLTLASLYVGVLIDMYITELDEWVKLQSPWWHSKNNRFTNWFVKQSVDHALVVLAATYVIPGVFAFIFARSFLVVESFISLRSLPKGSFKTVPWSNYWPHF